MKSALWTKMAKAFYNKDEETAVKMGIENYFSLAAANMLDEMSDYVEDERFKKFLSEEAAIARSNTRQ
jgi:hypothetical protein